MASALASLDEVGAGHEAVSGKAESLHRTCESLLAEQVGNMVQCPCVSVSMSVCVGVGVWV